MISNFMASFEERRPPLGPLPDSWLGILRCSGSRMIQLRTVSIDRVFGQAGPYAAGFWRLFSHNLQVLRRKFCMKKPPKVGPECAG